MPPPESIFARNNVQISGEGTQPMLFAHGLGCDQNAWRWIAPAFARDFKIVLFEHVGCGRSDWDAYQPERYNSLEAYARDVLEICEAANLRDVVFVGHSVGSTIGVLAANHSPQRFATLLLICPSPAFVEHPPDYRGGFERAHIDGLLEMMEKNYRGWASFLAPAMMKNAGRPELMAELYDGFCSIHPEIARRFATLTFLSDHRRDFAQLRVPSLMLESGDDTIVAEAVGDYLADNVRGSTVRRMKASGHCPHMSAPEETIRMMREYLATRISG